MLVDYGVGRRCAWLTTLCALVACTALPEHAPRDVGRERYALNAPVQSALATTTLSTSITATFPSPPTAGNLLVAIKTHLTPSNAITGPSGWTLAVNTANNVPGQIIYYKTAGAGESVNVTMSDGANLVNALRILEFSGFDGKNPPVVTSRTAATSSNNFAFTAVTTTAPDALLIAASINAASGISLAAPSVNSWTNSFTGMVKSCRSCALSPRSLLTGRQLPLAATRRRPRSTAARTSWVICSRSIACRCLHPA